MRRFKSARHPQRFLSARSHIHTTTSFAVTVSPPPITVPLATAPFELGAISAVLMPQPDLGTRSEQPSNLCLQPDNAPIRVQSGTYSL